MSAVVFTIVTRNRLHLARALMQSVRENFSGAEPHVLVVDPADALFDPAAEPFAVTFGRDLGLARFEEFAFVNDALGLCCLLKPVFALHLLQRTTADAIIYADSDMLFHARPDERLLAEFPVVLTPHVLGPLGPTAARTDADIMRSGAINAGFFAVRRHADAVAFLEWWRRAMCGERRLDATFSHDQQWLSLAPTLFPGVATLRDPGYNVAYWNITQRPLGRSPDGQLTAGGRPLVLFHYSFFAPDTPELLANRPPLVVPADSGIMRSLLRDYAARLAAAGAAQCSGWTYAYSTFSDGKRILDAHRRYYLERMWHDAPRGGSVFEPDFTTQNSRGLKRVYALDLPLTRGVRRVRLWLRGGA